MKDNWILTHSVNILPDLRLASKLADLWSWYANQIHAQSA